MNTKRIGRIRLLWLGLGFFTVWTLAPVAWALISSFLPNTALTQRPPDLSLGNFSLDNYIGALRAGPNLGQSMLNSLIVASVTALITIILGSLAAYALACLKVRGSKGILLTILASQMFPAIVVIIPMFMVLARLGLINTYAGLIIVNLSFVLPIVIWVLKGFFEAIPPEIEKSAAIDGAGPIATFRHIIFPLSAPPLFAAGLFSFIESWNEFFFAVILTGPETKTVPVAIAEFSGQYEVQYGQMVAAAIIAVIPVVVLAIVFRKYLIEGFVEGSVKG